jgi:hypothetical protein
MPTEKNAAFLPMQQGFKLDWQRVKPSAVSVPKAALFPAVLIPLTLSVPYNKESDDLRLIS